MPLRFLAVVFVCTSAVLPLAVQPRVLLASPPDGAAAAAESAERESSAQEDDYYELLKLFVDTLDQVERNHVKGVSRRELIEAAIAGMLAKLDEHTNYIKPNDFERFRAGVESEFPGVGVRLSLDQGRLLIVSALPESPAYRAGLGAGDVITHIGEEPTEKLTLDDAVKRLKGMAGTQVTVRVLHPGNATPESVTLTRELVRVETVRADFRGPDQRWRYMTDKDKGIAYVRVVAFGRHTAEELKRVLDELSGQNMKGLILDLRFNPGGLLTSAVEVADLFVTEGRIVSTSGRNVKENIWTAQSAGTFTGFPMVVLVNQYSASASEVVAACLQDHQRAVVVGQRTFGKGSVQNIIELEGGRSGLKLTTASYYRPSGKNIDRQTAGGDSADWGVRPSEGFDVIVSDAEARHLFRMWKARDAVATDDADGQAARKYEDKQFNRALTYLREQLAAPSAPAEAGATGCRRDKPAMSSLRLLALETTCDETAAAVITDQLEVLSSVVASQDALHERFAGVVPEIAARATWSACCP